MGFVEFCKGSNWNIQGVVMVFDEEFIVSWCMVKWIISIYFESFIVVEVKVKQFFEFVKSCCVLGFEFYIIKCYVLLFVLVMFGMIMVVVSQFIVNFSDEKFMVEEVDKVFVVVFESIVLFVSMFIYFDNIVMYKCVFIQ